MAQRVLDETSSPGTTTEETVEESPEGRETHRFFKTFALARVKKETDGTLRKSDVAIIEKEQNRVAQSEETDFPSQTGAKLAELGDFIDHYSLMEIREYADVITNKATFQLALTQFKAVVRCMFDENGQTAISMGRVLILIALCYEVCMAFIRKNMGDNFLSVVGIVGTWLWTAILQYKINQWLRSKGGWGGVVASASGSIFSWPWGKHTLLIVGLVSLTIWAVSYYSGK